MIVEEIKNIKSGTRELRQFGLTIGCAAGLLGAWCLWRGNAWYAFSLVVSGIFFFCAFVVPVVLKPFQKLWMTLALLMGLVVTGVIMVLLFYVVVTPIGLVARLCGKDFLQRKFDSTVSSYWIRRETGETDRKDYENQF
jgi:hypothetical protein